MKRDESMGVGTIIELTYRYLLCAVGTTSRSSMVPLQKRVVLILNLIKISSYRLLLALEFASHPDVQEFNYEYEDMNAQSRMERQRRMQIAIVGGSLTGVELVGELMDFYTQVCGRADVTFQHLRDHGCAFERKSNEDIQDQEVEVRLSTQLREVVWDYITIFEKRHGTK
ncbi:LOW QUALITY PROTEIN: hypothetical protein ACHAW6_000846 [Cyclotella cf. meneghiniana]